MSMQQDRVKELESTVEDLLEIVEQQNERIEELESTIEIRGETPVIENLWIKDLPAGHMLEKRKKEVKDLKKRVYRLEEQDVKLSPQDVINATPEDAIIPIQQMYNAVKNDTADSLSKNQQLAAKVWPFYRQYADPTSGTLTLRSPKVKDILRNELGREDPNPNTVRRVMGFIAKFSGKEEEDRFIEFDTSEKVNKLECSRQDWKDVTGKMLEAAQDSSRSAVATDGGETSQ